MNAPHDRRPDDDDQYSATVLGSHWIQRPEPSPTLTDTSTAPTVLRFGPGVTAVLAHRVPAAQVTAAPGPARSVGRLRRHALPVLVLVAAVLFVLWRQQTATPLSVREVTVAAAPETVGCDGNADVVAVVRTNGHGGTLSYRWVRNDGTSSAVLRTAVDEGQHSARLRLLWSFEGEGRYAAVAELRLLSPAHASADVRFAYDCPLSPAPSRP